MRTKVLMLFTIILYFSNSFSQIKQTTDDENLIKSKELFNGLLSKQFTKIMTGNSFSNFGRYAKISTDDETLSISGVILDSLNTNSVWTYNISGGVSDGIVNVFNNFELNSNIGASVSFNYIINPFKTNRLSIDHSDELKIVEEKKKLKNKLKLDSLSIATKKELIDLKYKKQKLLVTEKLLDSLQNKYSKLPTSLRKDSINFAYNKIKIEKKMLFKKINKYSKESTYDDLLFELYNKFDKDSALLKKKESNIEVQDLDITWISIGYGLRRDRFNLFNDALNFNEQVYDSTTVSHKINLGLSRYRWGNISKRDLFWAFSTQLEFGSNLSSLTGINIVDTTPISTNPQRDRVNNINAFVDEFNGNVKRLSINFDYYTFFGKRNEFALHLNPSFYAADFEKPISSFLTGIMIPFKNTEKQTSVVNIEIFYQFNDLFDVANLNNIFFRRNTIGVRASFPLTFF
ncbi:hypothetical protein [Tenacibaculum sp. 190524A05c]|uniref:hypothetical protein n=1 Tax=Tenacibaculum platacis TaxID=3137852 RepID=UPI0032B1A249